MNTAQRLRDLFRSRAPDSGELIGFYDRGANRWHNAIQKMGYMQAYDKLCILNNDSARPHTGEPTTVLDVGTGTGGLSISYVKNGAGRAHLKLLDPSPKMLQHAAANLSKFDVPIQPIEGSIGDDCVPPDAHETVLCAHVIEHTEDPLKSLEWLYTRLKAGGTLLLVVSKPHWCTALVRWKWGHKAFEPEELTALLEACGFRAIQTVAFDAGPPSRMSYGYRAERP